jgi:hypothetical protein
VVGIVLVLLDIVVEYFCCNNKIRGLEERGLVIVPQ